MGGERERAGDDDSYDHASPVILFRTISEPRRLFFLTLFSDSMVLREGHSKLCTAFSNGLLCKELI